MGQHDQQGARHAIGFEFGFEPIQIIANRGSDIGIEDRGHAAFIFADQRGDLTGKRQIDIRMPIAHICGDLFFVIRINEGPEQADGQCLNPVGDQRIDCLRNNFHVEVDNQLAMRIHALGDGTDVFRRDDRRVGL